MAVVYSSQNIVIKTSLVTSREIAKPFKLCTFVTCPPWVQSKVNGLDPRLFGQSEPSVEVN